ncbi:hypothetical protein G6O69_07700 [Pseudenhygromyxa sp. WMMC2535]|uniref:serine/threonine protein kinase n=1 Tax=Pseudenhygromyxa sp. WMMC2535 TaxID=2712867 RepID=UPI001557473E|nr:hypothetical protein [Pseudenhygromyxa sp. WMMC2535]NVB37713.1 hypothetical protein [Pseudenhygromyxa sp. WMMC2535]
MPSLACPHCEHEVEQDPELDAAPEVCPSCGGSLLVAYRYRLVARSGELENGVLYEARDDGFDLRVGVLFVTDPSDRKACARFINGHRSFADLRARGLVKIHQVSSVSDPRPYVVMDWLAGGTLGQRVQSEGPLPAAEVIELAQTLLIGLSYAHRSMPALIHCHIHPGKVGFVSPRRDPVLFGFEWAQQIFEQDSHLADAFISSTPEGSEAARSSDLRQLAHVLIYAATGEWLSDRNLPDQRRRARETVPGPLGVAIDRMLTAGHEGYESAVDASLDFERLIAGDLGWRRRTLPTERPNDEPASAFEIDLDLDRLSTDAGAPARGVFSASAEDFYTDEFTSQASQASAPPPRAAEPSEPAREESTLDVLRRQNQARAEAQAQAQAQARAEAQARAFARAKASSSSSSTSSSSGRSLLTVLLIAGAVFGVRWLSEIDLEDVWDFDSTSEYEYTPEPDVVIEAIPNEAIPSGRDPSLPAQGSTSVPADAPALLHYTGKVTRVAQAGTVAALGDSCELWFEPKTDGNFNCRFRFDCTIDGGTQRLYGASTTGFTTCTFDPQGMPIFSVDEEDNDGDAAFEFSRADGADPVVRISDSLTTPPVLLAISFDEVSEHPGPVPEVEPYPRAAPGELTNEPTDALPSALAPTPSDDGPLPDKLSTAQVLASLDEIEADLLECEVAPGTTIRLTITIGNEGRAESYETSPTPEPDAITCISEVLGRAEFERFRDDEMSVVWPVRW